LRRAGRALTLVSFGGSAIGGPPGAQEAINAAMEAYASRLYDPSTLGRYAAGNSLLDPLTQGNYGIGRSLLGPPTLAESLSARTLAESLGARTLAESLGMQGSQIGEVMRKQQEKMMEAFKPAISPAFDASKIASAFPADLLSQIRIPTAHEVMARTQQAMAARTPTPTPAKQAKSTPAKKASAKKSQPRKKPPRKQQPAKEND
jgi:hypothetical protein